MFNFECVDRASPYCIMAAGAISIESQVNWSAESAQLRNNLQRVVPKINAVMSNCKEKVSGITQPAVDEIVSMSLQADLAVKKNVMGRNCGIHPENRARTGVDPFNAQNLALKISLQGYSESKLENPMGFEKAIHGPLHHKQEAFNVRNFDEANGYLKKIPFHDVEYLPVTCSHTFAAVNIIDGGCRGIHPQLCNEQSKIDLPKVLALCPSWKKPLAEGIPCIVFRRGLEAACPELPAFLSKAGTQSHNVHSKETKVQLMLMMHQLFVAQKRFSDCTTPAASAPPAESAPSADVSWERVVEEMSCMKPHFKQCADEAAAFAKAWSGGNESQGLVEVEAFAKTLKVRREPENGQLGVLAKAQLARAPKWPIACLKALLSAPEHFCRSQGEARMFTFADVKQMETKLMPQIMAATAMMEKARAWFGSDMECQVALTAKILGDMDVRLVMHIHGFAKKIKTRTQFASIEAIGQQLAQEVKEAGGDLSKCPWKLPSAVPAQPAKKEDAILAFAADGSLDPGQLKDVFGMELGTTVVLKVKGDHPVYHIANIQGPEVTLIDSGNITKMTTTGELVDLYKVSKVEEDIVVRTADFLKIEKHSDAKLNAVCNQMRLWLYHAFRLHQPHVHVDLKLTYGRHRHVFAAAEYEAQQLTLVPYSTAVYNVAVEGNEKATTAKSIVIKFQQGETYIVTLTPDNLPKAEKSSKPYGKAVIVPFWHVQGTSEKSSANMQHSTLECKMSIATGSETAGNDVARIPILTNSKALKVGDELLLFEKGLKKRKPSRLFKRRPSHLLKCRPSDQQRLQAARHG